MPIPFRVAALAAFVCLIAPAVHAQSYTPAKPRAQFISIGLDWIYTQPLHFGEHPVQDLVGRPVNSAHLADHDYESVDGFTLVNVDQFTQRNSGLGVSVYPFGMSAGTTLIIRGAIESLPDIELSFDGPALVPHYLLTGARAYDVGIGLVAADRSAGWGLGSHAFIDGGIGRIRSDLGDGTRMFAEGGGGLNSGPFGVEIAVKFAWNRFTDPVEHRFLTVPFILRGTVSF